MKMMNTLSRRAALGLALALAIGLGLGSADAAQAAETEQGLAAVYTVKLHGHKTASGERYNKNALTAAHKTLPFGTKVRVKNLKNGKTALLRINDRGPVQPGRVVDLSSQAAKSLGMHPRGLQEVSVEVVAAAPARRASR